MAIVLRDIEKCFHDQNLIERPDEPTHDIRLNIKYRTLNKR